MFRSRSRGHRLSAVSRLWRLAPAGALLILALAGAYAPTIAADASSDEISVIEGVLYYTRYDDHPNVKSAPYRYDGETFEIGEALPVASTHGADGILFAPDGDLIVGGQGERVHKIRTDGSGDHKTLRLDGASSFHVSLDPTGRHLWSFGLPGTLSKIPLSPFGGATAHPLSGDDLEITHIVFDAEGHAYYTASGFDGHGSFGRIDLERFETHRLIERLEAAHGMTFDGFTGNLILFGGNEVVQIDPADPTKIVSRITVVAASQFDQGTADGAGHLFAARNDGYLLFVDYAASGRIGDPSNVMATVFLDSHLDDIAPLSGPGANPAILAGSSTAPQGYPGSGDEDSVPFPTSLAMIGGALLLLAAATLVALWLTPVLGTAAALGLALAASAMAAHQAVLLYRTLTGQLFPPPDGMSSGLALAAGAALVAALFLPLRRRPSGTSELDRLNDLSLAGEVEIGRDETSWKEDWSRAKLLLEGLRRSNIEDVAGYLRDHPELIDMALEATRRLDPIGPDDAAHPRPNTPQRDGIALDATTQARFFADLLASLAQGGSRADVEHAHWNRNGTQSVTRIACSIPAQHAEDWTLVLLTMLRRRTRKANAEGAHDVTPVPGAIAGDEFGQHGKSQGSRTRLGPIGLLKRKTRAAAHDAGGEAAPVDPFADGATPKMLRRRVVDIGVILHKVARRETDIVSGKPPPVAVSGDLSAYAEPKLVKTLMRDLVRHALERAGGATGAAVEMAKPVNSKDDAFVMRLTGADLDWTDDALAKAREIIQQHGGRFWSEKADQGVSLHFALEPASRSAGQTAPSRWQMVSG